MIGCVDVHYSDTRTSAVLVLFSEWESATAQREYVHKGGAAASYQPGEFYKRELPPIMSVLQLAGAKLDVIIIDGYVWLDENHQRPGLGAHLFRALNEKVAVVGVAKSEYKQAGAIEILRGDSNRPLFITAVGMDAAVASEHIRSMHGTSRMPTLLALADRLARQY